ncbi:hypothetical protein PU634_07765 [Oceanimonas pelagia]|uniref:Uncharacterized protein n=1 Tax=Oceanimonas pelagia TaxID=3028314 RepID=A0AA50KSG4_9GAMM|nr:hypothetical protein [Oceanimonas pelagia]WMC12245.1 hypothetical protein PU634_07765 [Oceanimonas pelagia]
MSTDIKKLPNLDGEQFLLPDPHCSDYLTDRYSERVESAEQLSARVSQCAI